MIISVLPCPWGGSNALPDVVCILPNSSDSPTNDGVDTCDGVFAKMSASCRLVRQESLLLLLLLLSGCLLLFLRALWTWLVSQWLWFFNCSNMKSRLSMICRQVSPSCLSSVSMMTLAFLTWLVNDHVVDSRELLSRDGCCLVCGYGGVGLFKFMLPVVHGVVVDISWIPL